MTCRDGRGCFLLANLVPMLCGGEGKDDRARKSPQGPGNQLSDGGRHWATARTVSCGGSPVRGLGKMKGAKLKGSSSSSRV